MEAIGKVDGYPKMILFARFVRRLCAGKNSTPWFLVSDELVLEVTPRILDSTRLFLGCGSLQPSASASLGVSVSEVVVVTEPLGDDNCGFGVVSNDAAKRIRARMFP